MIKCKHVPPPVRYKYLAHTTAGIPQYINEDNNDDDDGMTRCVCTNTLGYIFNYILPSLTRPYYGVIRHATARTSARSATANFYSFSYDVIFLFPHSTHSHRTLSYPDASTFLPNAAPCNL